MSDKQAGWFLNRWARPADATDAMILGARRQNSETPEINWVSEGPANIAGRSTCLAVDPRNPQRIFLGTAGGGLWFSGDGGQTWAPKSDQLRSLSIGAVTLDPSNPDLCYFGTGEANLSLDSYPGCGIFRTGPQGWEMIGAPEGKDGKPLLPYRIGAIAVDPFDPGHLMVGSATKVDDEVSGLHHGYAKPQPESGFDWESVSGHAFQGFYADARDTCGPYRCHSVVFHPGRKSCVFASVFMRGWNSGIYRSNDGGVKWKQLGNGLPSGDKFGRTSLAMGKSGDRWVLWAYAAHTREGILGVFRSDDEGESWRSVGGKHFANEKSGDYSNCIAVCPNRATWVVCGGRDLHRSKDGGTTWQQITENDAPEGDPHFAPAEHHAVAVADDGFDFNIHDANDCGFATSPNFGQTWRSCTSGLVTSMIFKVDVAGRDAGTIVAGLHRNGTISRRRGDDHRVFRRELRGQGGWVLFDLDDAEHVIASGPGGELWRRRRDEGWKRITPPKLAADEVAEVWLPVVAMDGDRNRAAPRALLLGGKRLWKSADDGETWRAVSVELDGSPVSALHISRDGSRRAYAGTERGAIFSSADGGNSWSENLAGIDLPYRYITRIDTRPDDAGHVLVTIGPTPPPEEVLGLDPYSHIYLSTDGGRTWRNADPEHSLPNAPHNCVVFDHRGTPFVATDFGVYQGTWSDENANYAWEDLSGDLPKAFVMDLACHAETGSVTAATYGRGIFRYKGSPKDWYGNFARRDSEQSESEQS